MTEVGIPEDHLREVCQIGKGPITCSYVLFGPNGFQCAKGTSLEATLCYRREHVTIKSLGDNCGGPPSYQPLVAGPAKATA